jgi:hypothetical protein
MIKQIVFDVIREEDNINVYKDDIIIYSISVTEKSISLKYLYISMDIKIEDDIRVKKQFEKIESPQNDADRIFNNTIEFMNKLLYSVNEKLSDLRELKNESIFK